QAIGAEIMPEYIEITKSRIKSAENGHLKIRPMNRSVYDPNYPQKNIPPKTIKIKSNSDQLDILQPNKQLERLNKHFPAVPVKVILIDEENSAVT
ncbi:MAG: hypothetical protein ACT6FB_04175, partial [Methanosarcinaceae archaeon]